MDIVTLWSALAIWLSWLWVALGQWLLAKTSIEILGKNPKLESSLRVFTILWIALVESAAIYWFIVAFQILWNDSMTTSQSIWAWLAVWITAFWAWFWEWKLVSGAMTALTTNPENKNMILQFMILFIALVESAAIYGLVVAQKILW